MKFLITCLSIFFSISTVHAKKIYASIRNDMGQSIVVDLLGSKLPNGTGDVIATNTIAANATWTDSKLKIPDGFINVKARAKVTATGQVIETSWENISASKFYSKVISGDGSSGSGKEFDFKDFTSIDKLFQYDATKFVQEGINPIASLKPLNNLFEEYLGGILLFKYSDSIDKDGNRKIIYIDKISPKQLGNEMKTNIVAGTTTTDEFDFNNKVAQKLNVSIVNLFNLSGAIEDNKIYHFKTAFNNVGEIKYTAPSSTSIHSLVSKLDSQTLQAVGMQAFKYGDDLIASQITTAYGFSGIYAEITEYQKLDVTNSIGYNTFGHTSGNYERSLSSKKNVVIPASYIGYYANRESQIDLMIAKIAYAANIATRLEALSESQAKIFYEAERIRNPKLPAYTNKQDALLQLYSFIVKSQDKPGVSANILTVVPPATLKNINKNYELLKL